MLTSTIFLSRRPIWPSRPLIRAAQLGGAELPAGETRVGLGRLYGPNRSRDSAPLAVGLLRLHLLAVGLLRLHLLLAALVWRDQPPPARAGPGGSGRRRHFPTSPRCSPKRIDRAGGKSGTSDRANPPPEPYGPRRAGRRRSAVSAAGSSRGLFSHAAGERSP